MEIKKIEIKNYRGFEELTINFDSRVNILVGINGSGKTSILDLIASFLNAFLVQLSDNPRLHRHFYYNFNNFDINIKASETSNNIYVDTEIEDKSQNIISWELKRNFKGGKSNFKQINSYIDSYRKTFELNPKQGIPIFKYFPSQRNSTEKKKSSSAKKKKYFVPQFEIYDSAFTKTLNFEQFVIWFVEEENKENRAKVHLQDLKHTSPKLDAVRKAITLFLKKFPAVDYDNLKVNDYANPSLIGSDISSLVINKNGEIFNLAQLSDGEKNLILMVADIAHRLALANPVAKDCLQGKGIILIDEIDLHLHPSWQREVIPCLQNTFPNLQFIVTTHSPQVLGNVKPENILIIEDFKIVKFTPHTFGNDANTILWDIFGVKERPKHTQDKLDKLYELIEDQDKQKEAKKLLNELKEQLGEGNSEFVKAKLHYDFQNDID